MQHERRTFGGTIVDTMAAVIVVTSASNASEVGAAAEDQLGLGLGLPGTRH